MTESTTRTVIVVRETPAQSLIKDAGTYAVVVGVIGTGVLLGSPAMEWAGFGLLALALLVRIGAVRQTAMTPQEAADLLAAEYGVRARCPDPLTDI